MKFLDDFRVKKVAPVSKKCPHCYTHIPLKAKICPSCKNKVGLIDKHGMATRRIDWMSYIICFLAWLTLGVYIWMAFL
ncbi:MAG: hypothetical protein LJE94_13945 [Deltaproteobacteria bacterium]|jgi:DNA polymerase II large subunit|nr:hypothetical protein [Deltaproteobacteria bacterium]